MTKRATTKEITNAGRLGESAQGKDGWSEIPIIGYDLKVIYFRFPTRDGIAAHIIEVSSGERIASRTLSGELNAPKLLHCLQAWVTQTLRDRKSAGM